MTLPTEPSPSTLKPPQKLAVFAGAAPAPTAGAAAGGGGSLSQSYDDNYYFKEEEDFNRERDNYAYL